MFKRKVEEPSKNHKVDTKNNSSNNLNNEPNRKKNKFNSGLPSSMQKEDLFDAHDFDIDIDVDIGGAFGGTSVSASHAGGASSASGSMASGAPSLNLKTTSSMAVTGSGSSNKRSFNMKDYKEKRGLQ